MNLVPAIVKRYGKGTDSDATDAMVVPPLLSREQTLSAGHGTDEHIVPTLRSHTRAKSNPDGSEFVTASTLQGGGKRGHRIDAEGAAGGHLVGVQFPTLRGFGHGWQGQHNDDASKAGMVRRLTPVECERLQGWPDGWTLPDGPSLADEPNHPHRTDEDCPKPDGPRYAAAGDGVTANVSFWIGKHLMEVAG